MAFVDKIALPNWASVVADQPTIKISVDPDKAYPALLAELGVKKSGIDQYWAEVVYQCAKMDCQAAMLRAGGTFGFSIKVLNRPAWALANLPAGRGTAAATQGREARDHYIRIRGSLPGVE
jgi:hypothetical protein